MKVVMMVVTTTFVMLTLHSKTIKLSSMNIYIH